MAKATVGVSAYKPKGNATTGTIGLLDPLILTTHMGKTSGGATIRGVSSVRGLLKPHDVNFTSKTSTDYTSGVVAGNRIILTSSIDSNKKLTGFFFSSNPAVGPLPQFIQLKKVSNTNVVTTIGDVVATAGGVFEETFTAVALDKGDMLFFEFSGTGSGTLYAYAGYEAEVSFFGE